MTNAMLVEGKVISYSDDGEGQLRAWCDGKEIRVDEPLRQAIVENEQALQEKHA